MSGILNGTAALISNDHPLALYLHCASHSLNLAVVKSLDEASVQNMIGIVNRVSIFFSAHPKRQRKLEEAIDQTVWISSLRSSKICAALDGSRELMPWIDSRNYTHH